MLRRLFLASSILLLGWLPAYAAPHRQDTGFLNRSRVVNGTLRRYVVYLPDGWNRQQPWPVILFLHGSGERGSEGMDETQIGLPQESQYHWTGGKKENRK